MKTDLSNSSIHTMNKKAIIYCPVLQHDRWIVEKKYILSLILRCVGVKVRFSDQPESVDWCINYADRSLTLKTFTAEFDQVDQVLISYKEENIPLLALGSPKIKVGSNGMELTGDVLTPLVRLCFFLEERKKNIRDHFGLILSSSTDRVGINQLGTPYLENLAYLIGEILQIKAVKREGRRCAIAVSCDIDELENDHIGDSLAIFSKWGVERPTMMICSANGNERNTRDPLYDVTDEKSRRLLTPIINDSSIEVGLHGSYLAHDDLEMLQVQKRRLERIVGRAIYGHRAHFYRFEFPRSWAWQYRAGFLYDASVGWPDVPGYRGGYSNPVPFFDPEFGVVDFYTVPTCILDQHFFWPEVWSDSKFDSYVESLIESISRVGGVITVDWHTYTISEEGYPGWWKRLDRLFQIAVGANPYLGGIMEVVRRYS